MYDGLGFAILLGLDLGIFVLVGFLVVYVLRRDARREMLPEQKPDALAHLKGLFLKLPKELQNEILAKLPDKNAERALRIFGGEEDRER